MLLVRKFESLYSDVEKIILYSHKVIVQRIKLDKISVLKK